MNPLPQLPYKYIAIEGNIGAGKTTLCHKMQENYKCKLILEQFADNPFLPFFYENPERYAFPVELFFMTERHKQLQENLTQTDLFQEYTVADYFFIKTLLFARNNLSQDEYRLFQRLFHILNKTFPRPDLLVFLHRPIPTLIENIKKRGRSYEKDIAADYLQDIQNTYFEYFRTENSIPILVVDVEELDFLNNEEHFNMILNTFTKTYSPGVHHVSFVNG